MYDPAVMGNKSPLVKDDFFFLFFKKLRTSKCYHLHFVVLCLYNWF